MAKCIFCALVAVVYCWAFSKVHAHEDKIKLLRSVEKTYCEHLNIGTSEEWLCVPGSHWEAPPESRMIRPEQDHRFSINTHELLCGFATIALCFILDAAEADDAFGIVFGAETYVASMVCAIVGAKLSHVLEIRNRLFCRKAAYSASKLGSEKAAIPTMEFGTARKKYIEFKKQLTEVNARRNQLEGRLHIVSMVGIWSIICVPLLASLGR